MRIPKGADVQLTTNGTSGEAELQITCALTTKKGAQELIRCIEQLAPALEGEKRSRRKPKIDGADRV